MQRVRQETFVLPGIHAECAAEILHFGGRSSQEVPAGGVFGPCARVIGKSLRLIMLGIESNREQHEILPQLVRKAAMENSEIVGRAKAEIGKRAFGVNKCNRNHLAP